MSEQQRQQGKAAGPAEERDGVMRRWAGVWGFGFGFGVVVAFFAFFPGLPHVIDWGALLVALGMGLLGRWGGRAWVKRLRVSRC